MSKIMTILEERVAPAVNKIGGQRHLRAVRNGIISMLPLTIVGSFFVIFLNVPIPGYDELIAPIKASLDIPFRYTVGISIGLSATRRIRKRPKYTAITWQSGI